MGSDPAAAYPPEADETPRRVVRLEPFRLARTPVTVEQYASFAAATGRAAPGGEPRQPVTYVSHPDALSFCAWAGARLPSEDEWEAAARGGDERLWPWGDSPPNATRALFDAGIGDPEPVGSRPLGASAYGVLDLAGNVCEWVSEPGIVRGGSFIHTAGEIRCAYREPMPPEACDHYVGFRVAAAAGEARISFDWVEIPGGAHALGRDPVAFGGPIRADELPRHLVDLSAFELTGTPVTNGQYAAFLRDTNAERPAAWAAEPSHELAEHPVTGVDWFDAQRFCGWAGGRLPTEAEWEKAARGTDERRYPWGDEEPAGRAVFGAGLKHGATAAVDTCADGASPYGLLHMAGNVWEWVSSAYRPYPYDAADGREIGEGGERVLRGGSFASSSALSLRCAMRSHSRPLRRQRHIGFRVAR